MDDQKEPLDAEHVDATQVRRPTAGENELFGFLAVRDGFISEATLEAAKAEADTKSQRLADVLVTIGAMSDEERRLVKLLLAHYLKRNAGDPEKSLHSLSISQTISIALPNGEETVTYRPSRSHEVHSTIGFGDYELLGEIAKGGMGIVYKARQMRLNRLVALKMIRSGELADGEQIKRFYTEAEAAAKLDHPGIVPVYEVGEQSGQHFYSMAFIEGESLHARVSHNGPIPPTEAASLTAAIAEAVEFAHKKGIVHRDIKPQNVLLDGAGQPRVTDFGLAKQIQSDSDLTAVGQVMGTPSYMPPEQAAGRLDEVGAASDVYSLGAIFYFLLTGRPPFQSGSIVETIRQVLDVAPVPPRVLNQSLPRDLDTICMKCLQKEASRRYASAQALADDLGKWLKHEPIEARRVGVIDKSRLWCKRRPAVASLVAVVTVILLLSTASLWQVRRHTFAHGLVERLLTAEITDVEDLTRQLGPYRGIANPLLFAALEEAKVSGDERVELRASLALLSIDANQAAYLYERLLVAKSDQVPVIVTVLELHKERLEERLWSVVENGSNSERIRAATALAVYNSANEAWEQVGEDIVTALAAVPASESDEWIEMLRPVGRILAEPLEQRFRDDGPERDSERSLTSAALADYLRDNPHSLTELILLADTDREFQPLLEAIRNHAETVAPELLTLLSRSPPAKAKPEDRDAFWKKQANGAVCLLELGQGESVWPLFEQTPDPSLRSFVIDRLALLGSDHESLAARIKVETDAVSRYALILALGQFDMGRFSSQQRQSVVKQMAALYQDDFDAGVHSAARWTLQRWQQGQTISNIDARRLNSLSKQSWFVNSQGQTFAVVNGPVEFVMNQDKSGVLGKTIELTKVTLSHRFAIATHEVTVAQFQSFRSNHQYDTYYAHQADCPVNSVSWYDAVAYCNWLTDEENKSRAENDPLEKCYEPNGQGEYAEGMTIPADYLQRGGYRLPTEEEWEFACRAWTTSSYGFGEPLELLTRSAWYSNNSVSRMWPVGTKLPNALGMFDMHGNAYEWCQTLETSDQPIEVVGKNEFCALRSGSLRNSPLQVRSVYRYWNPVTARYNLIGVRMARTFP